VSYVILYINSHFTELKSCSLKKTIILATFFVALEKDLILYEHNIEASDEKARVSGQLADTVFFKLLGAEESIPPLFLLGS
jgi:hypothetical protein